MEHHNPTDRSWISDISTKSQPSTEVWLCHGRGHRGCASTSCFQVHTCIRAGRTHAYMRAGSIFSLSLKGSAKAYTPAHGRVPWPKNGYYRHHKGCLRLQQPTLLVLPVPACTARVTKTICIIVQGSLRTFYLTSNTISAFRQTKLAEGCRDNTYRSFHNSTYESHTFQTLRSS